MSCFTLRFGMVVGRLDSPEADDLLCREFDPKENVAYEKNRSLFGAGLPGVGSGVGRSAERPTHYEFPSNQYRDLYGRSTHDGTVDGTEGRRCEDDYQSAHADGI